ncbi:hypothetical protein Dda_8894 [Drechslerella dactyloides]|uniref:Uncharacterized protein n=1 Tax=Drechslerella dactyloides TaxID=74499 RepID=A0AAD6IQ63_DREDA|nr:hypothetical protein Dda_8894 [Drechslerella dactyloides]
MENWPNVLSPQFAPTQMIIFSERKGTSYNWTPPNITALPIDEIALSKSTFDLMDMAKLEDYKIRAVACAINELNEKERRGGRQWVVSGVKCADKEVLLVVRVVRSND